jgi:hypothetical protein
LNQILKDSKVNAIPGSTRHPSRQNVEHDSNYHAPNLLQSHAKAVSLMKGGVLYAEDYEVFRKMAKNATYNNSEASRIDSLYQE